MKFFNKKVLVTLLLALVMVLSVAACASEDVAETEAPVAEEATEAPAAEEAVIVPEFTFTNTGEEEICEIYLSPVGQEAWGPDQLGGATIPAGEQYLLTNIPAGSYDIKAIGCAGSEVIGQLDIQP